MKQYPKLIILMFACIAIGYSACTKSSVTVHNSSTVSPKVVSSQVAVNLKQVLYGEYGSFSIADGIDPSKLDMAVKGHHLKIQSTQGDECGFKIDTTAQLDFNLNDTAKFNIWTRIKYEVLCTGGVLSGISVYDSLNVAATTSNYTITSKSGENLVLKLLTPGNKASQLSLNGSMNVFANLQPKKGTATSGTYNFTFTSLIIDPAKNGDIISGSATFATKGSSAEGVWDYKGTILFLPNHQAKITINGTAFTYDLQTGLAV